MRDIDGLPFFIVRLIARAKLACAIFVFASVCDSNAAASGNHKYRFDLHMGNSFQNFSGVSGASFSSIDRLSYSAALSYRFKSKFEVGFQYSMIPSIAISPFVFSDNIVGSYSAKFTQYELLLGIVKTKHRFDLLLGYEHLAMSGSPALTYNANLQLYYGLQYSQDMIARHMIRVPLFLRLLKKGARSFTFTNKVDDPMNVAAGYEIVFGTGADFEFK